MKTTANGNTGLSALGVMSTPDLARHLLPPTHPDGQHRMDRKVYRFLDDLPSRQCKSPLGGLDLSIFAVAGETGAEGLVRLVALG